MSKRDRESTIKVHVHIKARSLMFISFRKWKSFIHYLYIRLWTIFHHAVCLHEKTNTNISKIIQNICHQKLKSSLARMSIVATSPYAKTRKPNKITTFLKYCITIYYIHVYVFIKWDDVTFSSNISINTVMEPSGT